MISDAVVDDVSKRSWPARFVTYALIFLIFVFASMVGNVIMETTGVAFGWWDKAGSQHALEQVTEELSYIDQFASDGSKVMQQAATATGVVYRALWSYTGMGWAANLIHTFTEPTNPALARTYFEAVESSVQLVALRVVVCLMTTPAYVLIALLAFVDGLVKRDIRRFTGDRESSLVYKYAHALSVSFITLPWVVYLGNPWSINPNFVFGPALFLFGVTLTIAVSKFKKIL